MPSLHVPLSLLEACSDPKVNNIERLLIEFKIFEKGIYLPPKKLGNIDSVLLLIPFKPLQKIPFFKEMPEKIMVDNMGILLTPPGYGLLQFFQKTLGINFNIIELCKLETVLQKLLIEEIGLVSNIKIEKINDSILVELNNNLFCNNCKQTNSQPRTHNQVGCLLISSIACIITKVTGKAIIINKETSNYTKNQTLIEFKILEDSI